MTGPEATAGPGRVDLLMRADLLDRVRDEWRALAERAGVPFTTPEWHEAWLANHPAARPVVAVVRDAQGTARGVLAMVLSRRNGLRVLHFAGDDLGDAFAPVCAEGVTERAVARLAGEAIAASGLRWDMVTLGHIDEDLGWHEAFRAALPGSIASIERRRIEAPSIEDAGETWVAYLEGRRRTVRKETRRRRRRLEEDETHGFRAADSSSAGPDTDTLFHLHDLRWDDRGGSSIESPAARATLADFNLAAAERGWLQLWLLDLDGAPAAAELAWRLGGRQTHFQGGFDPEHASRGVGIVLFARALEDGFENGVRYFDLGQGTAAYKMDFASGTRLATTVMLVRSWSPLRPAVAGAMLARTGLKAVPRERLAPLRAGVGRLRARLRR